MSCGCPPTIATSNLLPVIYDPGTKQVRPLALGEKLPDGMCKNCERANAMALLPQQKKAVGLCCRELFGMVGYQNESVVLMVA